MTIRVSNGLDPDQDQQRLSADKKVTPSKGRVNTFKWQFSSGSVPFVNVNMKRILAVIENTHKFNP